MYFEILVINWNNYWNYSVYESVIELEYDHFISTRLYMYLITFLVNIFKIYNRIDFVIMYDKMMALIMFVGGI